MSDKILMENWRKYLVELDQTTIESMQALGSHPAVPRMQLVRDPSIKDMARSILDRIKSKILDYWRNEHQALETESDHLIELLEQYPFWLDIFFWAKRDFDKSRETPPLDVTFGAGDPSGVVQGLSGITGGLEESVEQSHWTSDSSIGGIVDGYHKDGTLKGSKEKWIETAEFVATCYLININESYKEQIEAIASPLGETSDSKYADAKRLLTSFALAGIGGVATGGVGAVIGVIPLLLRYLDKKVNKDDFRDHVAPAIRRAGITDRGLLADINGKYEDYKGSLAILAFHRLENHILRQLINDPYKLPEYPYETLAEQFHEEMFSIKEADMDVAIDKAREPLKTPEEEEKKELTTESKFHDNWRNFLLTEEKL